MRTWAPLPIAALLVLIASGNKARRVQSSQDAARNSQQPGSKHLPESKVLSLFLTAFNPAAAFSPSIFGAWHAAHTSDSAHWRHHSSQMKQNAGFGGFGSNSKNTKKKGKKPKSPLSDIFPYTGNIRPGIVSPMRLVPHGINRPDYADDSVPKQIPNLMPWVIEVKSPEDIEGMRAAGLAAREVLDAAVRKVDVGVTTEEIDITVHDECIKRGVYPSPLNYHRFPKSCCTSVNEVICHGIPDSRKLKDGDILNIDITVYCNGYHGDCSEMVLVGNVDEEGKRLVKVTHDALHAAMAYCKPKQPIKGIGATIEDYIKEYGFQSAPDFVGHGIGKTFHTNPNVYHVRNQEPGVMQVGNVFTIEPMICEGNAQFPVTWKDQWTETTRDGKRSAQFEHTLLVTPEGVEALTGRLPTSAKYWWEAEESENAEEEH